MTTLTQGFVFADFEQQKKAEQLVRERLKQFWPDDPFEQEECWIMAGGTSTFQEYAYQYQL